MRADTGRCAPRGDAQVEWSSKLTTEYIQLCRAVGVGFLVMGFIGYFVKVSRVAAVACERRLVRRWVWEAWEMEKTSGEGWISGAIASCSRGLFAR